MRSRVGIAAGLILLAGLCVSRSAPAAAPEVMVAGNDSLSLWVLVEWNAPLPRFVEDRLERGIPATVGLRADLVASRAGWFDRRVGQVGAEWKIARDPWGEAFLIFDSTRVASYDSLSALRDALGHRRLSLPLKRIWCDGITPYRVEVTAYVLPLSARDAGEVESWLKGQIRGLGRGVLGLPRGLFGVVRDLSGLGERASKGKSDRFQMTARPEGRVRVVIPGRTVETAAPAEPERPR